MMSERPPRLPRTSTGPSVIEQTEAIPAGARELAAARLALSVSHALSLAMQATGTSAARLAEELGVTQGAVSQVLAAEGNVRVATIGRYARALGYQACIRLVPVAGAPAIDVPAPGNVDARSEHRWTVLVESVEEVRSVPAESYLRNLGGVNILERNAVLRDLGPALRQSSRNLTTAGAR